MKKGLNIFMALGLVVAVSAFTFSLNSFKKIPPKTYTVSLPLDTWQQVLNVIDSNNRVMIKSDAQIKEAGFVLNGLSQLRQIISQQVGGQMQAEEKATEEQRKKDSIQNAGKKPK